MSTVLQASKQARNSSCYVPGKSLVSMQYVLPDIKQLLSMRMTAKYAEQRYYVPISVRGKKMISHKPKFL